MNDTDHQQRTAYTQGLRALADLLDANPDVPLPYRGGSDVTFYVLTAAEFAAVADVLDDMTEGIVPTLVHYPYHASGTLAGLRVEVAADPNVVCKKTVVGQVDQVEWRRRTVPTQEQHDRLLAAVEATPHDREKAEDIRASYRNLTDPDTGRLTHIDGAR